MSKRGYISRYLLILKKLKAKPFCPYEELQAYIDNQVNYLQMQDDTLAIGFSKRTFQRDVREIRNIFGVNIEYSKSKKGYFISESETENMNFQRMIEAFDIFHSLNLAQDLSSFIHLEKRRPQGTESLYGLLHAIKNKLIIKFLYQKFLDDEPNQRTAEPFALKEFKNRWYVLAKDTRDNCIKSFALDRLTNLEVTKMPYNPPKDFDIKEKYRYCFGITKPEEAKPEEVILSFEPFQGKYIKSLPLHETQQVVIDNDTELRIRLKLYITFDFVMELLSYGESMKVIKPESLVKEIKHAHQRAFKKYLKSNYGK